MKLCFKKKGIRKKTGLNRIKIGNNCALVNRPSGYVKEGDFSTSTSSL